VTLGSGEAAAPLKKIANKVDLVTIEKVNQRTSYHYYGSEIPEEDRARGEHICKSAHTFYESSPWGTVPAGNSNFVGREDKLAELEKVFEGARGQDGIAVVTQAQGIVGLGGVGKTQLVIQYLQSLTESRRYKLKVWLRGERSLLEADLRQLAAWLGFGFEQSTPIGQIAQATYARLALLSKPEFGQGPPASGIASYR
jgi:hypothetical protein